MAEELMLRRILMAVDASARGRSALDLALELSRESRAEWRGLFVEDLDLFHLAGLPFVREMAATFASGRPLDPLRLEQSLRRQAQQVQRYLADSAARVGAPWSFQVVRGHFTRELLTQSQNFDLCIVGREGPLAITGRKPVVSAGAVLVVLGNTPAGLRTLRVASRLAHAINRKLLVLEPESRTAGVDFAGLPGETERRVIGPEAGALWRILVASEPAAVVLDAADPLLGGQLESLLADLSCAVLLVR